VNLSKISGEIDGAAGLLQIKTLTATAASGPVSVTGTIGVLQAGLPLSLKVTAQHAEPLVGDIVTANVDATLTVIGKAREHLDVAGTVAVNRVTINIPDSLPPNVAVLDVRRLGAAAPSAPVRPLVIALDVAVHAPRQILVKGRGLDAELGGDLHLGGTIADPVVSGGFELQRGTFSLASSTLNFTAGRVSFDGAGLKNRIDPTLDFTADSTFTVPTVTTATLHIYGFADAPQFAFSSSPALPQDQILAGLLFGESASALSPLQIASIGDALATLSGGGGGLNPLTKLQKSLGLDRLSVGQATTTGPTGATTNTGASIEAGRYVTRRVFVEAKQTTQGTSQVQVNIDLTKHLKVQTRLGNGTATVQGTTPENDPGSSVGLIYQFEY
jgi:translocation and assembly module TamB